MPTYLQIEEVGEQYVLISKRGGVQYSNLSFQETIENEKRAHRSDMIDENSYSD